ncbi:MAG: ATP-binding protein [Candidatus Promineifilaceae bacterium]
MDRFSIVRDDVTIHCKDPDGWVETVVGDTESGIAAADSPFVIERFYRAGPTRQRETGGRGLGGSIAKQIAEAHQRRVWAESELGKGICIRFRLPSWYQRWCAARDMPTSAPSKRSLPR